MNTPSEHSDLLGGSSAERRYHCAASYRLEPGIPSGESDAAKRGTRLHEAIAKMLNDEAPTDVSPKETAEILEPAVAEFNKLCDRYDIERLIIERKVEPELMFDSFGTVDVIGMGPKHVLIVDWKFGFHPVDVNDNKQLQFYAYSAITDAKLKKLIPTDLQVVTAIIQPSRTPMVSVAEVTREELTDASDWWEDNYNQREGEPEKGKWCQWCKAKPTCSAHAPVVGKTVMPGAPTGYQEHILEFDLRANTLGVQLTEWRRAHDLAGERVKALEQIIYSKVESGEKVDGWKLVAKRNRRMWHDPEGAERSLRRSVGADVACPRQLISPPKAEELLGANYKSLVKYVTNQSSGVKLVPDTDVGDAVDVSDRFNKLTGADASRRRLAT